MKLKENLTQPGGFGNTVCHSTILSFSTGCRHCVLPLRRPVDQVVPEKYRITRCGFVSIWTACPICVRVHSQLTLQRRPEKKSQVHCASNVAQDTLQGSKVRLTRIMHVQANLLNGISDIRPGEGEILQGTGETPEVRGILNRWTISRQLGVGVHRSRARLALGHTRTVQDVDHVLPL